MTTNSLLYYASAVYNIVASPSVRPFVCYTSAPLQDG